MSAASQTRARERQNRAMYDFSVLRTMRKRDGLTIAGLSIRSGVSPAVISKLERNQTSAELSTLFSLGRAFGLNAADLIRLSESRTAHRIKESSHTTGGFVFREIRFGNLRALFGEGRVGGRAVKPEIHGDDYETCWVLDGCVAIALPNEKHVLKAGECVQFDAVLEHAYEVIEDARIMIVHVKKDKRF
jgi:transcriptional regulator with XRE-family HTH domain